MYKVLACLGVVVVLATGNPRPADAACTQVSCTEVRNGGGAIIGHGCFQNKN